MRTDFSHHGSSAQSPCAFHAGTFHGLRTHCRNGVIRFQQRGTRPRFLLTDCETVIRISLDWLYTGCLTRLANPYLGICCTCYKSWTFRSIQDYFFRHGFLGQPQNRKKINHLTQPLPNARLSWHIVADSEKQGERLMALCGPPPTFHEAVGPSSESPSCRCSWQRP